MNGRPLLKLILIKFCHQNAEPLTKKHCGRILVQGNGLEKVSESNTTKEPTAAVVTNWR
jgi:hypothetical protein